MGRRLTTDDGGGLKTNPFCRLTHVKSSRHGDDNRAFNVYAFSVLPVTFPSLARSSLPFFFVPYYFLTEWERRRRVFCFDDHHRTELCFSVWKKRVEVVVRVTGVFGM
jgi:hypothetical protein